MANPVNLHRGFFGTLYQGFKDSFTKPAYDKLHPYLGFGPVTDHADVFNPIIEQIDASSIDCEKLKSNLLALKEKHSSLLDYKTLELLDNALTNLNEDRPEPPKKSLANLSGALKSMRLKTAGWFSSAYRLSKAEPMLQELHKSLNQIKHSLKGSGNLDDLPQHIKYATALVERLNNENQRFFYRKTLSKKQKDILERSCNIFRAFAFLPDGLQRLCFQPALSTYLKPQDLTAATNDIQKLLETAIGSQEAILQKYNPKAALESKAKDLVASSTEAIKLSQATSKSYIEVLRDTIEVFTSQTDSCLHLFAKETRWNILMSVATLCDKDLPHFSNYFQDFVHGLISQNADEIFSNKDALCEIFSSALKSALEHKGFKIKPDSRLNQLIQLCLKHRVSCIEQQQIDNTPVNFSTNPFSLFSFGSSNFSALSIPFLESFFNSTALETWISTQSQSTQVIAQQFVVKVKEIINQAKLTGTTTACDRACRELKDTFQEHHVSLSGFPLPAFFENPGLTASQAEETVASVQQMRKMLDAAETDSPAQESTNIRQKIEEKSKEYGQNLQDFLTFKILGGYFLGKKDSTFFHIKKAQLAVVNQNREKYFYKEMQREISKSSLNFFVKKGLLIFLPFIYRFIGSYSKNIIANFHHDLNSRISSLNKHRLLLRATNCFSQYNALLKAWALKPEGGDKDIVIGEMMKDKRFLSFKDLSFSQKELYEKLSESITDTYFNFSKGPEDHLRPSDFFSTVRQKINNFVKAPLVSNRRSFTASLVNKLCMGIKAFFVGIPAHLVTLALSIPVRSIEMGMNAVIRKAAKSYLGNFQILHSLFDNTKENVFDNNVYVYPVTSFFADQLEALSKKLASQSFKDDEDDYNEDKDVISDKSRANLQTAFETLFELIKKNDFKTQDSLKAFIEKNEGLSKLKDDIDSLITSKIIDNVIDISFKAYHKMLSEESLQGPVLMLLENLNQSLLTEPNQSAEKKKAEHLKHQMAQEKLTKYSEKVLNQVIAQVIDRGLDTVTHKQSTRSTRFINWLKDNIEVLITAYRDSKNAVEDTDTAQEEKIAEFERLKEKHHTFQLVLESKFENLSASESSVAQELKARLHPVFKSLQGLLEKGLTLQASQSHMSKLENDVPHFSACDQAFTSLTDSLESLENQADASKKTNIKKQYEFLCSHLDKIVKADQELDLHMPSSFYQDLCQKITANVDEFKDAMSQMFAQEAVLSSLHIFNDFSKGNNFPALAEIARRKKEALTHGSIYHMLHSSFMKELQSLYQETKGRLLQAKKHKVPVPLSKECLDLLDALMHASSSADVDALTARIVALDFQGALDNQHKTLKALYRKANVCAEPLAAAFNNQVTAFEDDKNTQQDTLNDSLDSIEESCDELQEAKDNLAPMQFIDGELEIVKGVKGVPHALVYHTVKPKMQGILDLLRNGNFAQFLLNHAVVIPFVTQ